MKFRKKPVVIEAIRWRGSEDNDKLREFAGHWMSVGVISGRVSITTLEGAMLVSPGDWVIKGVQGEFYPCKPDVFDATYEPVDRP